MKGLYNIVRCTAAMAALGFSVFATSCSNDEPALPTEPGEITFTAPAEIENASSRVSYEQMSGKIKVTWDPEDIVQLFPDEKSTEPIATFRVESVINNTATFKCIEVASNAELNNVNGVFRYAPTGEGLIQTKNGSTAAGNTLGTGHLQYANTIEAKLEKPTDLTRKGVQLEFKNTTAIFRVIFKLSKKMESGTTIKVYGSKLWGSGAVGQTLTLNFEVAAGEPIVAYIPVAGSNSNFSGVLGFRVSNGKTPIFDYARTVKIEGGYMSGNEYTADLYNVNPYVNYDENGHGYVNLAGNNWATMNIGADDIVGEGSYGYYFVWGNPNKFNTQLSNSTLPAAVPTEKTITSDPYTLKDKEDAAYENWSHNWHMPTKGQFQTLIQKCNWTWSSDLNCYIVSSIESDALILLPAAGYYQNNGAFEKDYIDYWTSNGGGSLADCLYIKDPASTTSMEGVDVTTSNTSYAFPIRPIYTGPVPSSN